MRWPILAGWLAVFVLAALFAPRVTSVLQGGGYSIPASQSGSAYSALKSAYGYRALDFTAVFQSRPGVPVSRSLSAANLFRSRVEAHFGSQVTPERAKITPDRALVFVRLLTPSRKDLGIPLTHVVRRLLPRPFGVSSYVTGTSAIFSDMESVSDADLQHMELITFPIALLILLVIFGTLIGALMPVSMGPLTVTSALAAIFFLGHVLNMSIFVLNTASMLGLGVAIDYSLFMVHRFREELAGGASVESAVGTTVATAGRAISVSALVVATGFLGMTIFRVTMLTSLGIGGSVVVAISLLAALTFLPALLGVLGPRVNAYSIVPPSFNTGNMWHGIAMGVMKRPWLFIIAVLAAVTILALPARNLHVGVPGPTILPTSSESRQGDALLQRHLGLANQSPVLVVLKSPTGFSSPATRAGLIVLAGKICRRPVVAGVAATPVVDSPRQIIPCSRALALGQNRASTRIHSRVALISVFLRVDPSSPAAESFVTFLRKQTPPAHVRILIGGQTAGQLDFDNFIYGQLPLAILFVVGVIFIILAIAFRSLLLPIKAVFMNFLSVIAAYGATVFVFQEGHLRSLFGFTPTNYLDSIVPIFIFCVLFGLSTDYEVFLLSRVREEYIKTGDNTHSVAVGLEKTGRIITSAAAIMIVIFGAFSFANLVVIKQLGFAMAVGVLVDATLIRALLVPAAMRVLGRWNWWPARYDSVRDDPRVPADGRRASDDPYATVPEAG